uniref:Uncharacterized protein n=1 Tax=Glossina pallidipes TaxID=7398 RepID=A0A1B0A5Q2_GLOPL
MTFSGCFHVESVASKDHKPAVVACLLELQTKLETLTRQRSPSPATHARNTLDELSKNKTAAIDERRNFARTSDENGAEQQNYHGTCTLPQYFLTSQQYQRNHPARFPNWRRTPSFPNSGHYETGHRSSTKMGAQLYRKWRAAYLHRASRRAGRGILHRQGPGLQGQGHYSGDTTRPGLNVVPQQQPTLNGEGEVHFLMFLLTSLYFTRLEGKISRLCVGLARTAVP